MSLNQTDQNSKIGQAASDTNKTDFEAGKITQENTRIFVVLNPVAGTTDGNSARDLITKYCETKGWQCDIHETKKDEDLRQLVRDAVKDGADMVVASGGDGTVSAVVSGMVNSPAPMGILPAGTGNNLARDLSIPISLGSALDLLSGGNRVQTLDAMQLNDDYFVMNISVGISAKIMVDTPREEKRKFGFLAYIRHGVGSFMEARLHRFTAVVDGKRYTFSASEVMIANEKFMGMQPQIPGVEIDPNDGHLDVFIVRAQGLRDYLNVFLRFILMRKPEEDRTLRYLKIEREMRLQSKDPLPVQADGEPISTGPVNLTIKLIPNAIKIVVPEEEKK